MIVLETIKLFFQSIKKDPSPIKSMGDLYLFARR